MVPVTPKVDLASGSSIECQTRLLLLCNQFSPGFVYEGINERILLGTV